MINEIIRKMLAKLLEKYQRDNICRHASDKCKKCRFNLNGRCAYNLVLNVISNDLPTEKPDIDVD